MKEEPLRFADLLYEYRLQRGLSPKEVAARAGISPNGYDKLEKGKYKNPHPSTRRKLAKAFGLSAEEEVRFFRTGRSQPLQRGYSVSENSQAVAEEQFFVDPVLTYNLPGRDESFIGREKEIEQLLHLLDSHHRVIAITGFAGTGKTSLAIEIGYRSLRGTHAYLKKPFDRVIWISAKDNPQQKRWLDSIMDKIVKVFNYPNISAVQKSSTEEINQVTDYILRNHRILLLIDNCETIEDPDLRAWIKNVPGTSKVLMTSRSIDYDFVLPLYLDGLDSSAAMAFIRAYIDDNLSLASLKQRTDEELQPLIALTQGNPHAMRLALNIMGARKISFARMLEDLRLAAYGMDEIYDALYQWSWETLRPQAKSLLKVVPFFADEFSVDALGAIAGVEGGHFRAAFRQLEDLFLICSGLKETHARFRYSVHPLTRGLANVKLAEDPPWERAAREQWIAWYVDFVQKYGGLDWEQWTENFDTLEDEWMNILAVLRFCQTQRRYETLKTVWGREGLDSYTDIYGYWEARFEFYPWLIKNAAACGDKNAQADFTRALCWTKIMYGDYAGAERMLLEVWRDKDELNHVYQSELAHSLLELYIKIGKSQMTNQDDSSRFKNALFWLEQTKQLLELQKPFSRRVARLALLAPFNKGLIDFELGEFESARLNIEESLRLQEEIGWARFAINANNWLAEVFIKEGEFKKAYDILSSGLVQAKRGRGLRRIAYYYASFAHLYQATHEQERVLKWAKKAHDLFERLGMRVDAAEMIGLLSDGEANQ